MVSIMAISATQPISFGSRLFQWRTTASLTHATFAERLTEQMPPEYEVSAAMITVWEEGKAFPRRANLPEIGKAIAAVCAVPEQEVVGSYVYSKDLDIPPYRNLNRQRVAELAYPMLSQEKIKQVNLVGNLYSNARRRLGAIQEEIARKAHIASSFLRQIEAGKEFPKREMRRHLEDALGISSTPEGHVTFVAGKTIDLYGALTYNGEPGRQADLHQVLLLASDTLKNNPLSRPWKTYFQRILWNLLGRENDVEAAETLGISAQKLSIYRTGRIFPSIDRLPRLAQYFSEHDPAQCSSILHQLLANHFLSTVVVPEMDDALPLPQILHEAACQIPEGPVRGMRNHALGDALDELLHEAGETQTNLAFALETSRQRIQNVHGGKDYFGPEMLLRMAAHFKNRFQYLWNSHRSQNLFMEPPENFPLHDSLFQDFHKEWFVAVELKSKLLDMYGPEEKAMLEKALKFVQTAA